jgi:hypothetical protein
VCSRQRRGYLPFATTVADFEALYFLLNGKSLKHKKRLKYQVLVNEKMLNQKYVPFQGLKPQYYGPSPTRIVTNP